MKIHHISKTEAVIECGGCNHFHLSSFNGDCRDDASRLTDNQLDAQFGTAGWHIVDVEG